MIDALEKATRPLVTLALTAALIYGFVLDKVGAEAVLGNVGGVIAFWVCPTPAAPPPSPACPQSNSRRSPRTRTPACPASRASTRAPRSTCCSSRPIKVSPQASQSTTGARPPSPPRPSSALPFWQALCPKSAETRQWSETAQRGS